MRLVGQDPGDRLRVPGHDDLPDPSERPLGLRAEGVLHAPEHELGDREKLAYVFNQLIAAAVTGLDGRLVMMSIGISLAAVLFCLSGVALIVHYESINEFIMPSVLYTAILSLPVLGYFGVGAREAYLAHPIHGPLELMRLQPLDAPGGLAYAIGYPLIWIVPISFWSRRALRRLRCR